VGPQPDALLRAVGPVGEQDRLGLEAVAVVLQVVPGLGEAVEQPRPQAGDHLGDAPFDAPERLTHAIETLDQVTAERISFATFHLQDVLDGLLQRGGEQTPAILFRHLVALPGHDVGEGEERGEFDLTLQAVPLAQLRQHLLIAAGHGVVDDQAAELPLIPFEGDRDGDLPSGKPGAQAFPHAPLEQAEGFRKPDGDLAEAVVDGADLDLEHPPRRPRLPPPEAGHAQQHRCVLRDPGRYTGRRERSTDRRDRRTRSAGTPRPAPAPPVRGPRAASCACRERR